MDHCETYTIAHEDAAKESCERAFAEGRGTWAHILVEEVAEALGAPTEVDLREELVQVAAVAIQWVRCIDRRQSGLGS